MSRKVISYGVLSDYEQDADGHTFFGAGNSADGWTTTQDYSDPNPLTNFLRALFRLPLEERELTHSVGLKVHYRTGEDVDPTVGQKYHVDGGYQQDGVHGASGTNMNRASWNVDFSLFDEDGDFEGATIKVDINPTARKDFLVFHYEEDTEMFVAKDRNGDLRVLETGNGNGAEKGDVLQDSINLMFFADLIDNDGNARNGFQPWDMEHGQFDIEMSQIVKGFGGSIFGTHPIHSSVTVNVGDMLIPDMA